MTSAGPTTSTKSKCDCQGPGSPDQKYSSHLAKCPEWKGWGGGGNWSSKASCKHWQEPVEIADGLTVRASGWSDRPYKDDWVGPDVGLYFDRSWLPHDEPSTNGANGNIPFLDEVSSQTIVIPWPDRSIPWDLDKTVTALRWLTDLACEGKTVEVGCIGGHGRTGTALAALLVLQGVPAGEAIDKVRNDYCSHAIESFSQEVWVERVEHLLTEGEWISQEDAVKLSDRKQPTPAPASQGGVGVPKGSTNCPDCNTICWNLEAHLKYCYGPSKVAKALDTPQDKLKQLGPAKPHGVKGDAPGQWCNSHLFRHEYDPKEPGTFDCGEPDKKVWHQCPECGLHNIWDQDVHERNGYCVDKEKNEEEIQDTDWQGLDEWLKDVPDEKGAGCFDPPCRYPEVCDAENGDCFAKFIALT